LESEEIATLLRELVENKMSQPSFVSIEENQKGTFNLIVQDDFSSQEPRQFPPLLFNKNQNAANPPSNTSIYSGL
jgi:hypothetical protein